MPKTKKDLMYALAERIGGEQGERMRAALDRPLFRGLKGLERTYTEEEFAAKLDQLEADLRRAFRRMEDIEWDRPATWGLPN